MIIFSSKTKQRINNKSFPLNKICKNCDQIPREFANFIKISANTLTSKMTLFIHFHVEALISITSKKISNSKTTTLTLLIHNSFFCCYIMQIHFLNTFLVLYMNICLISYTNVYESFCSFSLYAHFLLSIDFISLSTIARNFPFISD